MCKCFVFPHFCWDPALCKDTSCQAPSDLPLSAMASEHPGDVGTGLPPSDPPLPFLLVFFFFSAGVVFFLLRLRLVVSGSFALTSIPHVRQARRTRRLALGHASLRALPCQGGIRPGC